MPAEAYEIALEGGQVAEKFFTIEPREPLNKKTKKEFWGDEKLANVILRMRDSMFHYKFQCATAEGDIGRLMNVMSVSDVFKIVDETKLTRTVLQVWTYTFTGSGKSKYANKLLGLTCNFEFKYSKELQYAILNNWLCNLSGINGCWFSMDLMQEKNIKQLKKMSQKRNATFGGTFFKQVIAVNIREYLAAMASTNAFVGLAKRGGTHR